MGSKYDEDEDMGQGGFMDSMMPDGAPAVESTSYQTYSASQDLESDAGGLDDITSGAAGSFVNPNPSDGADFSDDQAAPLQGRPGGMDGGSIEAEDRGNWQPLDGTGQLDADAGSMDDITSGAAGSYANPKSGALDEMHVNPGLSGSGQGQLDADAGNMSDITSGAAGSYANPESGGLDEMHVNPGLSGSGQEQGMQDYTMDGMDGLEGRPALDGMGSGMDQGSRDMDPGMMQGLEADRGMDPDMDFNMESGMGNSYRAEDDFSMYAYADPEAFEMPGGSQSGNQFGGMDMDDGDLQSLREMDDMSMYAEAGMDDSLQEESASEETSDSVQSVKELLQSSSKEESVQTEQEETKSRWQQAVEALSDVLQSVSDSASKDSDSYSL